MRKGFIVFSANKDVDLAPSANALAAETLMKWRRVVFIATTIAVVIGQRNSVSNVGIGRHWRFTETPYNSKMTRREAAKVIGATTVTVLLPINASRAQTTNESPVMLTRIIPSSGEKLPVIGLGTWNVFDVDLTPESEKQLGEVLSLFVKLGGRVVDSSPMYGRSEEVIGRLATKLGLHAKLFLATKVWTRGRQAGIESMERSLTRMQTKRINLMQVHNLVDVSTQLGTMRDWKAQGRFRYVGVTHYNATAFPELEKILRGEKLDFLQINYSIMEREAEELILPLAQDRQIAVIINRPFGGGDLFSRVRAKPLPAWAGEFDCHSWAQFFLKWILAHPAVTCAIPATNNSGHLEDNLRAGLGWLPDPAARRRMTEFMSGT
jgi:aryl-alcohol dehydrogenase-like predicted oxidoreductase